MVLTAVSTTKTPNPKVNYQNQKRQTLLPSEAGNGTARKPKSREVTSRYQSSSLPTISTSTTSSSNSSSSFSPSYSVSSRKDRSSVLTRAERPAAKPIQNAASVKRSLSADRRRPGTPVRVEMSEAAKLLLTTSTKSLSVSFQRESFPLPFSKVKSANNLSSPKRGTPERRLTVQSSAAKDRINNAKPSDQLRWPGRLKPNSCFLTQSLDCGNDGFGFGFGSRRVVPLCFENNQARVQGKPKSESFNVKPQRKVGSGLVCEASDGESISSGSASSGQEGGSVAHLSLGLGKVLPLPEQNTPDSKSNVYKSMSPSKQIHHKKYANDKQVFSPTSRGFSSPLRLRPASPSKALPMTPNYPLRGMPSPTRTRSGDVAKMTNTLNGTPTSTLSFATDVIRKGKAGENQVADALELRLLYNRHLQWCFINARAEVACYVHTENAERTLYDAYLATSKLRHSVRSKKTELLLLKHNLKLYSVFKQQVPILESWGHIDEEHCSSLSAAICALEASTIRLPVVDGARADIQKIKEAICSTVDVMQAMASSICSLLPKVEHTNALVNELSNTASLECASLDKCKELLSMVAAIQVKHCSLRTHLLQPKRNLSGSTTEVQTATSL
ncbi:unnamed protein product [Cuscuta europaea]|uniref:Uncharacterized protein n=1 Tax=Cuscuta europaea TaxID=41803 RepID=A0A9P1DWG7_CUSEU|nr:unnamed protein product [Cuscuta europaea]